MDAGIPSVGTSSRRRGRYGEYLPKAVYRERRRAEKVVMRQRRTENKSHVQLGSVLRRLLEVSEPTPSTSYPVNAPLTRTETHHSLEFMNVSSVPDNPEVVILSQSSVTSVEQIQVLENVTVRSATEVTEEIPPNPSRPMTPRPMSPIISRNPTITRRAGNRRLQVSKSVTAVQGWYDDLCASEIRALGMIDSFRLNASSMSQCNMALLPQLEEHLRQIRAERDNVQNIVTSMKAFVSGRDDSEG